MKALNDLSKKQKGDKVFDALGGEWTVDVRTAHIGTGSHRPIKITNHVNRWIWVSEDGRTDNLLPPTFFAQPVILLPYLEDKEYVTGDVHTTVAVEEKCDFSAYLVWDLVYFADGSSEVVTDISDRFISAGKYLNMPLNGKDMTGKQVFFHAPPKLKASNPDAFRVPDHIAERAKEKKEQQVDWANVPVDTIVEIKFRDGTWRKRYYAGLKDGCPAYFANGVSSITAESEWEAWAILEESKIRLAKD